MSFEQWRDPRAVVLRGKLIREFSRDELLELSEQIEKELPPTEEELTPGDMNKLAELEIIEDELEQRR